MWCAPQSEFFRNVWSWSGSRVLEELDTGAVAGANHPDLLDDCARVDVHQLVHEVPGRIAEGAERERVGAAERMLEPGGRRSRRSER